MAISSIIPIFIIFLCFYLTSSQTNEPDEIVIRLYDKHETKYSAIEEKILPQKNVQTTNSSSYGSQPELPKTNENRGEKSSNENPGIVKRIFNIIVKPVKYILSFFISSNETSGSSEKNMYANLLNNVSSQILATYPEANWCGKTNSKDRADSCCTKHNNCQGIISPGETSNGLKNSGYFPRYQCSCEERFYDCLKAANTSKALSIGNTYFNIIRTECFVQYYPAECIKENRDETRATCAEYKYDYTKNVTYQWVDNKKF